MSTTAPNDNTRPMIFFDLDGVLADFSRWIKEQNKIKPDGKIAWEALDEKWWATMPPCAGAKDAYDAAKKLGIVKFLTSPARYPACFAGKAEWVENFTGIKKLPLRDLILCFARDKQLLASPGRILIDDSEENIDQWIAAGGIGILHKGDFKETMKALQQVVATITTPPPKQTARNKFNRAPGM